MEIKAHKTNGQTKTAKTITVLCTMNKRIASYGATRAHCSVCSLSSERRVYHRKDVNKAAGRGRESEQRECPEHD